MLTVLLVIGILVFLIVAHELGHFIAAKIFRVKVEEFGIGYPPRAFRFGKIGDTEYTLNWIPFGGFVRLFGDIGEGEHGRGSLVDANRAVQALILVAGVAANAVAAWALYAGALHVGIPRPVEAPVSGEEAQLVVVSVVPGSPAESAGIVSGDRVLYLEDERGVPASKLTQPAVSQYIQERGGKTIYLTYLHANATTTAAVVPAHAVTPELAGRPSLGVSLVLISAHPLPWGAAASEALSATRGAFVTVVRGLGSMFAQAISGQPSLKGITGPIGLVEVVGEAAGAGWGRVLGLAAFISVNLAIVNLLPIPALDGGRLLLLGIETVIRRQAPRLVLQIFNAVGIALIVFLMVTVTYNDIVKLIS